ncbi:protoporphyrinogen oxidase [Paludibacter sp.]|uniref:protoporphyrinogen oxidase n=1 Tax=Paludibacter sp. TaxID=1898105 RepID=UPI0013531115|nr:protoporphyrinogen oxidase [Paludibacter sp.]MTK52264.1 protoporphyrinogen oxidase [Paludibacter sp.]
MQQTDIIVIGAGLTGLTCAHHLAKKNRNFIVVETQNHVGGVINTVKEDGFVYETGPNTGVISHPEVADLFEDLKDKMTYEVADESAKKRYVLKKGKWVALPSGLVGGVTTPLFTWFDKFRLLGEPFRKPGTNPEETLAEMVKRRMGKSFLNYAVDPFVMGVYAGDPAQLVTKYALPKLYNLEQNYGSFIGGSVKKMREPKDPEMKKATKKIFSVKGGLSNFMEALQTSIGKERILLGLQNITVEKNDDGYLLKATNAGGDPVEIQAKQVVSTAGAYALPELFPFLPAQQVDKIKNLHYTRVVEVALGFKQWKGRPLDAFGALIPFCEKRDILGIMFMSTLFENRAPKEGALVTIFIGGVRRQELCDLDDNAIRELVAREAKDLLELDDFNPDLFKIMRHSHAIPQYRADSKERFEAIEQIEAQYSGLILAGNLRNGIGMADRIKQGKTIAEML